MPERRPAAYLSTWVCQCARATSRALTGILRGDSRVRVLVAAADSHTLTRSPSEWLNVLQTERARLGQSTMLVASLTETDSVVLNVSDSEQARDLTLPGLKNVTERA